MSKETRDMFERKYKEATDKVERCHNLIMTADNTETYKRANNSWIMAIRQQRKARENFEVADSAWKSYQQHFLTAQPAEQRQAKGLVTMTTLKSTDRFGFWDFYNGIHEPAKSEIPQSHWEAIYSRGREILDTHPAAIDGIKGITPEMQDLGSIEDMLDCMEMHLR